MLGLPLGLALSFFVSGTIAERRSWQAAFYVAGLPGLLLAIAALFITDPERGGSDPHVPTTTKTDSLPFLAAARRVLGMPTMRWIIASGAIHNFNMYALGTFLASFLKRYHQGGRRASRTSKRAGLRVWRDGYFCGRLAGRSRVSARRTRAPARRLHRAGGRYPLSAPGPGRPRGSARALRCLVASGMHAALRLLWNGVCHDSRHYRAVVARHGDGDLLLCHVPLGSSARPSRDGLVSDHFASRAAVADGSTVVTELHKGIGLHDAMYLIPILNAALVVVLFAAMWTVQGDYWRQQKRREASVEGK